MPLTGKEIIGRLLKVRERFIIQDKPVPKTIKLNEDKVKVLTDEVLQFCMPSDKASFLSGLVSVRMVLGMRIIEV